MKKKNKFIFLIIIVLVIIIASMGMFLSNLKKPDVYIKDIKFKSINLNKASITFLVQIDAYNPNDISTTLNSIDVDVYIDSQFIGIVNQELNEELKAKEHTILELDFILHNIPLLTSNDINVNMKGFVKITVFTLQFNVDVEETKNVEIIK